MNDDDNDELFTKANLSPEQQARLRERLAHPDQELLDVITEYLLEEHDDPMRELDLLAMLNTLH